MCTNASSTAAVVFIVLYKRRKSLYAPLDPCGGWCPTFGRVQRGLCCRSVSFLFPPLCVCCLGNSIGTLFSHPVCYLSCSNFSILFWLGWIIRPGRETTLQHHVLLPRHYSLYTALLNISKCSSKNTTSFNFSVFLLLPPCSCCFPVQSRWDADLRLANFRVAFNRNSCGGPYHVKADADLWSLMWGARNSSVKWENPRHHHHRKCTRGCRQLNSRAMDSSSVIVIQANGKLLVGALLVQYSRIMPTCLYLDRVLLLWRSSSSAAVSRMFERTKCSTLPVILLLFFSSFFSNVNEKGGVGGLHSMAPSQRPAPFLRSRTLPSIIVPGLSVCQSFHFSYNNSIQVFIFAKTNCDIFK